MSYLYIKGVPFYYEEESLSYDTTCAMSVEDGILLLKFVKRLFNEKKLPFYLAYGTLLGAIRDHGFIPGDEDIDVFVNDEDKLKEAIPYFRDNGLFLIRVIERNTYSFRINKRCYIDVYILSPIKKFNIWRLYCYCLSDKYTPKKYFSHYQTVSLYGDEYLCPENPEKILAFWYGKQWGTPVRGHKFYYEVRSHYIWWNYIWLPCLAIVERLIGYKYWKNKLRKS